MDQGHPTMDQGHEPRVSPQWTGVAPQWTGVTPPWTGVMNSGPSHNGLESLQGWTPGHRGDGPGVTGNEWLCPHSGHKSPPWWTRVAPTRDVGGGSSAEPCARPLSPQGMVDTAKKNFGGGNTAWEEKSLSKYEFRWVPHPCSDSPASALDMSPRMPSPTLTTGTHTGSLQCSHLYSGR